MFKRKPIEDEEHRSIIPNISVIVEEVDDGLDAVTYSAMKRTQADSDVTEVFTYENGPMKFKNAVNVNIISIDKIKITGRQS